MQVKCKCGYKGSKLLQQQYTHDQVKVTGRGADGQYEFEVIEDGGCDPFPPLVCPECFEEIDENKTGINPMKK